MYRVTIVQVKDALKTDESFVFHNKFCIVEFKAKMKKRLQSWACEWQWMSGGQTNS